MVMGMFLIALATSDSVPDGDSLPVFQAPEVVATASLPGTRAETLALEPVPARALSHLGVYDYGDMVTPGLSGLPSRHTRVLLQGIPANSPATGTIDLSLLPLPLLTGGLATLSGRPEVALWLPAGPEARLIAGSFGLVGAAGFARPGPLLLGLSFRRADNCFAYTDEFGREFKRENADEEQTGVAGLFSQGDVSVFLLASATERGVPGPIGSPTPFARLSDTLVMASAGWKGLSCFGTRDALVYSDRGQASATTATSAGLSYSGGPVSLDASRSRALGTDLWQARGQVSVIRQSWFARAGALFWKGLYPTGDAGMELGPLGLQAFYGIVPPALNDLAWPEDGFAVGNPSLSPEKMWGGEISLEVLSGKAWASLRLVDDYIAWVPGEKWTPVNLRGVISPEAGASFRTAFLDAGGSWNPVRWQGERLAHVPDIRGWARFFAGPVWFSGTYTGPRATTPGGARELPGFLMLDAGLSFSVARFTLALSLLNLLGETPQQVAGYPLPGRRFLFEIKWR